MAGRTTLERTIVRTPSDAAFSGLAFGPGEPRLVREELAAAVPGRETRRRSLLYFAHLSDPQVADEESPARVEALDSLTDPAPFAAAWRPQEALGPFAFDSVIDQVNRFADQSPVAHVGGARAQMRLAMLTGDVIDNQQLNELEWVRTLLEGGTIDPNTGTGGVAGCPAEDSRVYTGVQDYDDYSDSPEFYDPDEPAGRFADWPAYLGLMDRAQQPFVTAGLKVPSYIAYGNHDRLIQGNQAATQPLEQIATGCLKPLQTFPDPRTAFTTLNPDFLAQALATNPGQVMQVPPDPRRTFLTSKQYKETMLGGTQADGHGFGLVDGAEESASAGAAGYYAFKPARGVRFIVMDSTADIGIAGPGAGGNIDDPQYRWIEKQLETARERDELVLVFSHATAGTMDTTLADEGAPACGADDAHGHPSNPGCDADPRASEPLHTGADMAELFKRTPNVIAWVAGHIHENSLAPFKAQDTGFWEIESASVIDVPQQSRLIEVMDNRDGTLSLFGTVLDSSAPLTPPPPGDATAFGIDQLASLARVYSFNDPQGALNGRAGDVEDRNVELVIRDPRRRPGGAACIDRIAPRTVIVRKRVRISRARLRARGRSRDADCAPPAGPAARRAGRVARVDVALRRRSERRCRFLTRRGTLSRSRSCHRPVYLRARVRYSRSVRATRWRFSRRARLRRGRYTLIARGRDGRANVERPRRRSRVRARVR